MILPPDSFPRLHGTYELAKLDISQEAPLYEKIVKVARAALALLGSLVADLFEALQNKMVSSKSGLYTTEELIPAQTSVPDHEILQELIKKMAIDQNRKPEAYLSDLLKNYKPDQIAQKILFECFKPKSQNIPSFIHLDRVIGNETLREIALRFEIAYLTHFDPHRANDKKDMSALYKIVDAPAKELYRDAAFLQAVADLKGKLLDPLGEIVL